MDYKKAGVDIEAGYKSVELMKEHVKRTMREEVLGGLGGFSGAFSLKKIKDMDDPVLLSGTDGCGTKVKLAMILDKHDTIGIDAVAMCVNDIACAGGEPLFFLDYIACGKNYPEKIAEIVSGVAEGCVQYKLVEMIKELTAEKQNIYDYLDLFTMWFRDVLLFKATKEVDGLIFKDQYNYIKERAKKSSYEGIENIIDAIGKARERLHSNVNFDLVMELLFMTIREN